MKTFFLLSICLFINVVAFSQGSISGQVNYANTALTPIHDSAEVMVYQGTTIISQMPVNPDGSFNFTGLPDGTYTVKALVNKKAGGWNLMDSYRILTNFIQIPPLLSGIYLTAGDVNGSGGIPDVDRIAIARRFVGQIPSFQPPYVSAPGMPDWVSETITVNIISGSAETITVLVLCTGDVNGSFTPY